MSINRQLWKPTEKFIKSSNLTKYNNWLKDNYAASFHNYEDLWKWSVDNPEKFWRSLSDYFEIKFHDRPQNILSSDEMPHTRWFEGATLNYAEHVFRQENEDRPAILFASEEQKLQEISWKTLKKNTAAIQHFLKEAGVQKGDRVVGYLPNTSHATAAFLAATSLGAIWSSCSPDFGSESVLDRFKQINPKVLIAVDGYKYSGKSYDRISVLQNISNQLPSLKKILGIPYLNPEETFNSIKNTFLWGDIIDTDTDQLSFTPVPFSHPLWILYSSGTTGAPKAITHSHGGMLLEHLKYLSFHNDVRPGENFFWYSTTGWMMWNFVQASLLVGATIVLYDGSAGLSDLRYLWQLAEELPIHHFGTSAPFIIACMKRDFEPKEEFDLSALRSIGSTGAPLPPEGFDFVYQSIKEDVWLCSMSGGTDICTALVGGSPWKPVLEGEIQARALGCSLYSYDEDGQPVYDEVGEMVITEPMPCMPIFFWGDKDCERYESSYFEMFPGIWRHGDWVNITQKGGVTILGRSDTTLNRQGIRIGTAEIYSAVDKIEGIKDSLIVNIELPNGGDYMPLFVLMQENHQFSSEVKNQLRNRIKEDCSPRHIPDEFIEVMDLPYTISGKKMEAPVKKLLMGKPVEKAANKGAMKNPESLDFFIRFAKDRFKSQS